MLILKCHPPHTHTDQSWWEDGGKKLQKTERHISLSLFPVSHPGSCCSLPTAHSLSLKGTVSSSGYIWLKRAVDRAFTAVVPEVPETIQPPRHSVDSAREKPGCEWGGLSCTSAARSIPPLLRSEAAISSSDMASWRGSPLAPMTLPVLSVVIFSSTKYKRPVISAVQN